MARSLLQAACLCAALRRAVRHTRRHAARRSATGRNSSTLHLRPRRAGKRRQPRRGCGATSAPTRSLAGVEPGRARVTRRGARPGARAGHRAAPREVRRRPGRAAFYRGGHSRCTSPRAVAPPLARRGATRRDEARRGERRCAPPREHARAHACPCALRRRKTASACSGDAFLSRARRQGLVISCKRLNSGAAARATGAPSELREIGALCALGSLRSERSGAAVASKGFGARGRDGVGGTRGLAARWRGSCVACLSMAEPSGLRLASGAHGPGCEYELRVNKIRRTR